MDSLKLQSMIDSRKKKNIKLWEEINVTIHEIHVKYVF